MRAVPEIPLELTLLSGERFSVDGHGYLRDPQSWTQGFADYTAGQEGITLTDRHWALIRWIRAEEADHGVMPDARFAMKFLGGAGGKPAGRAELFELFSLRLRQSGDQDRRNAPAARLVDGLTLPQVLRGTYLVP